MNETPQQIPDLQPTTPQEPVTPPTQPQPVEPASPDLPPQEPKKSQFSTVAILIIIIAVSAYIAVASQVSLWPFSSDVAEVTTFTPRPTSDATVGWETYRNDELGFEVMYPPDWQIKFNSGINFKPSVITLVSPEYLQETNPFGQGDIDFIVYDSIDELSEQGQVSADSLSDYLQKTKTPQGDVVNFKQVEFNGRLAFEAELGGLASHYSIYLEPHPSVPGRIYQIFFEQKPTRDILSPVENQILSTFKFIEPGTANWKMYRNDEYGFEFRYPPELDISSGGGSTNFLKRFVAIDIDTPELLEAMKSAEGTGGFPLFLRIGASERVEPPQFSGRCEGEIIGTIQFGDIAAVKCQSESMGSPILTMIFSRDGVVYYDIRSDRYFSGDMDLVDQILSTFKFN